MLIGSSLTSIIRRITWFGEQPRWLYKQTEHGGSSARNAKSKSCCNLLTHMKNEIPLQSFRSAGVMNRPQVLKVVGLLLLVCALQLYGTNGATIIPIDVPGAATGFSQGTFPTAINSEGVITGYYTGASDGLNHGFLRAPNGTITPFDPTGSQGTQAYGINPAGEITGFYYDSSGFSHGFLQTGGSPTAPAPPASFTFTFPQAINPAGSITGFYEDANGIHFFLRHLDGTFTPFDNLPGGIQGFFVPNVPPRLWESTRRE